LEIEEKKGGFMAKFGFIGLGIMGSAMARNLCKAGFEVAVWNRSQEKSRELLEQGAKVAATPADVVHASSITFAMLADPAAAEYVCFAPHGVLEAIGPGKGYVDMSTVDTATSTKIASAITAKGGRFLEAPVSGSRKPAEDGTLVILAAGDRSLYDDAMPALERLGSTILHLGDVGNGAAMKLVVNMIMGGMMASFCEGLALGSRAGLSQADILAVIAAGAMANPMFKLKGEAITKNNFATSFPLKHMQKDLRLALGLGDQHGQPMFSAAAANESFKRARSAGLGDEDFSAVYKAIKG
jgi:2-hydroxy-3-oxopropionate reductase